MWQQIRLQLAGGAPMPTFFCPSSLPRAPLSDQQARAQHSRCVEEEQNSSTSHCTTQGKFTNPPEGWREAHAPHPSQEGDEQVRRLFATASPYPLKLAQQAGDVELVSAQQQRLMAVAVRTMALPLGRGALALGGTLSRVATATRHIHVLLSRDCCMAVAVCTMALPLGHGLLL